jgi:hypothetical protein
MTKVATVYAMALCSLTAATSAAGEVQVGLQAGPNFASLRVVPAEEGASFRTRTLAGAGGVVDVALDDRVSLHLEPAYVVKGSRFEIEPDDFIFPERVTGSIRLSYLELPALLRVTVGGDRVQPYLVAGPTLAYLLTARIRGESGGTTADEDAEDTFEKIDLGLSAGGGVRVPAGRASVFIEGRYSLGLWNIGKDAREDKLKTRGVQVGAGLTFPFRGRSAGAAGTAATLLRAQERGGFWIGFGLGHGLAKTSCDRASLNEGADLGTCEGGAGREGGAIGSINLGGTLGSRVLVGAELTAWSGFTNPTPVESFVRDTTLANLIVTVHVYPVSSAGLFLKGGIGVAAHTLRIEDPSPEYGLGLAAGMGYDVRIGRNVSLTPAISFLHGRVGDATTLLGPVTLTDMRHSVLDLSLGVTLH